MQRRIIAITSAFALAFPASAAAGDETQVGSQSNTTKQSASSSATAKSGPIVVIGDKNHVTGANNSATSSASNSNVTNQWMDQAQGGGDGDSLQVGSQANKTVQDAKCKALAESGPIVVIGDKNHVKGNNSATCSSSNSNETNQDMDQSQGGEKAKKDKKQAKKDKKEKGDKTQVGAQDNTTKQDARCDARAESGEIVVIGDKNHVKGNNSAKCESKNRNETDQDLDQDQD